MMIFVARRATFLVRNRGGLTRRNWLSNQIIFAAYFNVHSTQFSSSLHPSHSMEYDESLACFRWVDFCFIPWLSLWGLSGLKCCCMATWYRRSAHHLVTLTDAMKCISELMNGRCHMLILATIKTCSSWITVVSTTSTMSRLNSNQYQNFSQLDFI